MNFDLYYAAVQADEAFHAAVVSVYGEKRAGDMRYRKEAHEHPAIKPAHDAWQEANAAWLKGRIIGEEK